MTRFLLAENPIHPEQSGVWVIHLRNPTAIIQCLEGHVFVKEPYQYAFFSFKNAAGIIEKWTLYAYHFFTTDFISQPETQVQPLLNKSWRWYRAYLEWEDANITEDEE